MRTTTNRKKRLRTMLLCGALMMLGCEADSDAEGDDRLVPTQISATLTAATRESGVTTLTSATPLPLLDGERDAQFLRATAQPVSRLLRGAAPEATDLKATWRALHDSIYLYLFVEVADDLVVVDSATTTPWEDDAVEIFLDGDGSAGARYDGIDDVQLIVRPGDAVVHLGTRSAPVQTGEVGVVHKRTSRGYQLEIYIPWRAVGTTSRIAKTFGMDVHVDDDDDGGARDHKLAWWSRQDDAWEQPARFARMLLAQRPLGATSFEGLGDLPGGTTASVVTDLNAVGDVAVGYSEGADGTEAFRWSREGGMIGLRGAPSRADAVSPDGRWVVGQASSPSALPESGVIWRNAGDFTFLQGGPVYPGQVPLFTIPEPLVVGDDGRSFGRCKQAGSGGSRNLGCRFDAPLKITLLQPLSIVYVADAAGNVAGVRLPYREPIGSVAVLNETELGYPTSAGCILPHECRSEVRDFSAGAAVVVGTSSSPPPRAVPQTGGPRDPLEEAGFVYTRDEGMVRLPDLPGGPRASGAYAVSSDGRMIGGHGADETGVHAVVWYSRTPSKLADLVVAYGGRIPRGWRLQNVRSVSADGRTFVGNGRNPEGDEEAFRVELSMGP